MNHPPRFSIGSLFSRLRSLVRAHRNQSTLDREMREEFQHHLAMRTEHLMRDGMSADEADRQARLEFGHVESLRRASRISRGLDLFQPIRFSWLDLKMGLRMLTKYPLLTIIGGIGMAVGVAVSVGAFAFLQANLFVVPPLDEGERIVALENRNVALNNEDRQALHDFVLWRSELRSIVDLGAFRSANRTITSEGATSEAAVVAEITASGFDLARVKPVLGRYLRVSDEPVGAEPVVVIGEEVWQRRFASTPDVVGKQIKLNGSAHTVVGVMPAKFGFPQNHQYWTPLRTETASIPRGTGPSIFIFGRLADGVSMEQAQAELDVIGKRTATQFPQSNAKLHPMVMPYIHSLTDIQGMTSWMAAQMQLMMSILLVVVALNVAMLVYARTATRQGEIAVRSALGASRRRIIGQLFAEALVLSLVASVAGLAIAHYGLNLANGIMDAELGGGSFWSDYSLQPQTVLFTVFVAVVSAAIVGILPALQATGRKMQSSLRQLGGGTGIQLGRTWTVLVVAQVAVAVAALPAAVSMGWGEVRTATTRNTFDPSQYVVAGVTLENETLADGETSRPTVDSTAFGRALVSLLREIETQPEVVGASFSTDLPGRTGRIQVEGREPPPESPLGYQSGADGVALDYLDLYGARMLSGRPLSAQDLGNDAATVIVNQAFVWRVLGGGNAIGKRIRHVEAPQGNDDREPKTTRWFEIVGVVQNLEENALDSTLVRSVIYYAVTPEQTQTATLEVRTRPGTAPGFGTTLRNVTTAVNPALRLGRVTTRDQLHRQSMLVVRLVALGIGLVLVSVFLLSAGGVYALTSFTVTRRRKEIGIRAALGANPRQVLASVFGRVARQIGLGVAIGLGGAVVVDQASGGALLGGRAALLLPTFGVLMALVAVVAAFGPARRGLRIEPTEALRAEA